MTFMHDKPVFSATLTPFRSMDSRANRRVVILYAVLTTIPGLFFFHIGAWPVVGFLGLDIAALWLAFKWSRRSGRAYEEVTLWSHALKIISCTPAGRITTRTLNPFWVRLHLDRDYEDRIIRIVLNNREHRAQERSGKSVGEHVEIGAFLNPDDKTSFARIFSRALISVKS